MYETDFAKRLCDLRISKGISARDMSLSIGQSDSYINKIENGKSFPSMQMFFYICEFLDVTPQEFFDDNTRNPTAMKEAVTLLNKLDKDRFENMLSLIRDLASKK